MKQDSIRRSLPGRPAPWRMVCLLLGALAALTFLSGCQPTEAMLALVASPTPTLFRITATPAPTFTNTQPPATFTPTSTATPTETTTPYPTDTPLPTYTSLPTYTPFPSPTPTSLVPPRPNSFLDYPDTVRRVVNTFDGNPDRIWEALADWGAIREGLGSVRQADVTRDGTGDLVVWYVNPQGGQPLPQGDVLVFTESADGWRLVFDANFNSINEVGLGVQLLEVGDLNNDRLAEMAWTHAECGAHTCFTTVEMGAWTGEGFSDLTAGDIVFPSLQKAEVVDQNGDGPAELLLTGGLISSVGAGPQRIRTELYRWNGTGWALGATTYATTDWLPLIVWEANDLLARGKTTEARDLYFEAVSNPALKTWNGQGGGTALTAGEERTLLTSFSRWRLVLTHAIAKDDAEAEKWLQRLRENQPTSVYRQIAERFWERWQNAKDLASACEAANAVAAGSSAAAVDPLNTFGYANPQFQPADICIVPES